ncbi:hypothetical protein SAMN06264364_1365 [Quadrisphaera granulorum]|uniref:STAS domain-containing protein n=2 Tax=Quadrisphaera granulorum TaxID=317664 RepID=A0A315ZS90_9ACTN|nr:hypothetical protein BXY45_1365 [Quadrisphaera granulorum]SZE98704.1 hypothetical protein SAMN06264364_1365 [Quadrisphaera granulorum]
MHVLDLPRPRRHHLAGDAGELTLTAPVLGHGEDLGTFAVQVRRAIQQGATSLVVDESACVTWSPGQLLVLEHLRRLAQRCGTAWSSITPEDRCA